MSDQQEAGAKKPEVKIYPAWCKRCGLCEAFCPAKVFELDSDGQPKVVHPEKCVGCYLCELRCPDFAIQVDRGDKND